MEGLLLHVGGFGHHREVWLDHGSHLDVGLFLVLSHLGVVLEPVILEEVVVHLHVCNALVVHQGLEANCTEIGEVYSALHFDLTVAPTENINSNC